MAFLVPADLARVDVTGSERADYLETVTSQHLGDARPGEVRGALYLDAHGAPVAIFDVVVLPDVMALLTPDGLADEIVEVLGGRTFLTDAAFARTDDVALRLRDEVAGAAGPADGPAGGGDAARLAAEAGLDVEPGRVARGEDGLLVVGRDGGLDLVGPATAVEAAADELREAGARDGDLDDYEAWRVRAGVPAWGREVVAPHLPEELGLLPTHVHLDKGCYPGQEAVARMWMLGRPRRRLAVVDVHGTRPAPGTEIGGGRRKATVTSVAPGDGDRALAFVPGGAAVGERVEGEDGVAVEVVRLVGEGLPVPGHDPTVQRRRDRR